jgi:hypothetical protein
MGSGVDGAASAPYPATFASSIVARMNQASTSLARTVCLGMDLAWWGGQPREKASCWDALVGHEVGSLTPWHQRIDLRAAPNAAAKTDPCVPNYDASADLLVEALGKELRRLQDAGASRFLLAIDAPLTTTQGSLPPRPRAAKEGETVGLPRSCDLLVNQTKRALAGPWQRAVQIQPGAPLCPRVGRLVERITGDLGFTCWDGQTPLNALPERTLIEIFPAEAIWALGVGGFFNRDAPDSIRLYKCLEGSHVTREDASAWASRPLNGFVPLLKGILDVAPAIETLVEWACEDATPDGTLVLTKRYDDLVDSGIAWLTALSFLHGDSHVFVAPDSDGHIVGPSKLPAVAQKPNPVKREKRAASPITAIGATKGIGCYCGCGGATDSFFTQGHDAKVKGWLLKKHGLSKEQIAAKPLADLAVEHGYGPKALGG